jgi:hypothetical protein
VALSRFGLSKSRMTKQKGNECTMPYQLFHTKVADYAKWKQVFDADGVNRRASGYGEGQLFRSTGNPNDLIILFQLNDLEKARQFTQSEGLREKMQEAGVAGHPDIYFLEEVERIPH